MGKNILVIISKQLKIEKQIINFLRDNLANIFKTEITIKFNLKVPEECYDLKRGQYYSDKILQYIKENINPVQKTLAIVEKDLYTKNMNFIFGQADFINGIAVISVARLYHQNKNKFMNRIIKEAVHELGHLFGLSHCDSFQCVMYFSNSLFDTDKKNFKFCKNCQGKIKSKV